MKQLTESLKHYIQFIAKFKKTDKKRGSPKLIKANKKTANILVLSGISLFLLIGLIGCLKVITVSNKVSTLQKSLQTKPTTVTVSNTDIDNRLTYYLNDFISAYFNFSDDGNTQIEQTKKLNSFYNFEPDIKSQGQLKTASTLESSKLIALNSKSALYQVTYQQKVGDDTKEITTGFNIPYGQKDGKYYISGLPWFSTLTTNQATSFDKQENLQLTSSDNFSTVNRKKLTKFLNLFFTNYTSDQDNLDLIAKNLVVLNDTEFKSIDYTYFKKDGKNVIAYVQATFEIAGNTHSENFTLTLISKGKSYYVSSLTHTIPQNYATEKGE
ncbi:conjugal transfer protein [Streptococcus infantarius]|uniref:conjugal transfer protein n=1 Tax=Streptococcus infantarius TaxID=102684 RepID=UPI003D0E30EC